MAEPLASSAFAFAALGFARMMRPKAGAKSKRVRMTGAATLQT